MSIEQAIPKPDWTEEEVYDPVAPPRKEDAFTRTGIINIGGTARFTVVCLALFIVLSIAGLFAAGSVARPANGEASLWELGLGIANIAGMASWAVAVPLRICIISGFLIWLVGAAKNAEFIDETNLRVSPGWQAAWYFLPPFHLFVPVFGMYEIISHSRIRRADSLHVIMLLWWSTWLLGTWGIYLARLGAPLNPLAHSPLSPIVIEVARVLLLAGAAGFLIVLIRRVTSSQKEFAKIVRLEPE